MTTIRDLTTKLEMEVLTCPEKADTSVGGCYLCDLLSYVIGRCKTGDAWVTVQTNVNVVAVATLTEAACVIFPEGIRGEEVTLKKAAEHGVVCLTTQKTAFEIACAMGDILRQ